MSDKTKADGTTNDGALDIAVRENAKLINEKAELQVKFDKAEEEKTALLKKLDDSKAKVITLIADQLYLMRKITSHASLVGLEGKDAAETAANIDAYKQKLSTRTMESLQDAVEDERADFEQKIADLEKLSTSNVTKDTLIDPTLSDTSNDDLKDNDNESDDHKDAKDVL